MFSRKASRHHLLDLPAELRERIFIFAVTSSKTLVTFRLEPFQRDSYQEAVQPTITQVSRPVRREALPLYYDSNEFVLHTEGSKANDARRWLECSEAHLSKLTRLAFWVRYMPFHSEQLTPSGALSVALRHNKHTNVWLVDKKWRWITVVRKPADLAHHGEPLVEMLAQLVSAKSRTMMDAGDYEALLRNLPDLYFKACQKL